MEPGQREPEREEFVALFAKGAHATGQYHCAACGYGITLHSSLPQCPMCGGDQWEQVPWGPFSRALALERRS